MLFRRKIIALFLLLLILGGGYWLWRAQQHPYAVPVSLELAPVRDLGSDPVEVTLHKYYRNRKYRKEDWITTGESITFAFPADMYHLGENQRGGPQWKIRLWLDYHTLEAIKPKLRMAEKHLPDMDKYSITVREVEKHNVFIQIYSGAHSVKPLYANIIDDDYILKQEYCDLYVHGEQDLDAFHKANPAVEIDVIPFSVGEHFFSLSPDLVFEMGSKVYDLENDFYAYCPTWHLNRYCTAKVDYQGWDISFQFPKEKLCDWRGEVARTRAFLDQHVVKQTGPREPNKEGEK